MRQTGDTKKTQGKDHEEKRTRSSRAGSSEPSRRSLRLQGSSATSSVVWGQFFIKKKKNVLCLVMKGVRLGMFKKDDRLFFQTGTNLQNKKSSSRDFPNFSLRF